MKSMTRMCELLSHRNFGEVLGCDQVILLPQHNVIAATFKENQTILKFSGA